MKHFTFSLITFIFLAQLLPAQKERWHHAQGRQYYPLMVSVVDKTSGSSIEKAEVSMVRFKMDLPKDEQFKSITESYYKVRITDSTGIASLYCYGSWSMYSNGALFQYLTGIVKIEAKGYKTTEVNRAKWISKSKYRHDSSSAPFIKIEMVKKLAKK